jgi:hypothetical protein
MTRIRGPAARCVRVVRVSSALERAWGMPGARCTRSPCAKGRKRTVVTTVAPKSPGIPARNGLTAYVVLSPATNSSCHRHRRIDGFAEPGRARKTSANLTPATGARTTRFCRPHQRRSSARRLIAHRPKDPPCNNDCAPALPRPPHPVPTSVTIAKRPSVGRDGVICSDDLGLAKSGIFLETGLDRANHIDPVQQITSSEQASHRHHAAHSPVHRCYDGLLVRLDRRTERPLTPAWCGLKTPDRKIKCTVTVIP